MVALSMLGAALMLSAIAGTPMLVGSADAQAIMLYTDPGTGQVFTKRCKHCVRLGEYVPAGSTAEIERRVERKTQAQLDEERAAMQTEEAQRQAQQQQWNAEMAKQVSEIQPFAQEFGDRWYKKISVGTLIYADYGYFTHTGFGPQFLTQQFWPGPGNNSYSAFNITRTYLDFKFTPVDDVSARVTPNMYLANGTATGVKTSASSGLATTLNGNLGFRVKYAYLDYNTFFQKVLKIAALHDDKITFGQQQNPLVDWEENLWGYRYTALTPWNYLSLSSTQVGVALKGPIKFNEKQYADYDVGVYDDASFHAEEDSAYKQVMGRVTINPFGAESRYDGLGLTGFYDYGYPAGCSPDQNKSNAACAHITRAAALAHYTGGTPWGQTWGVAAEWDYGHNAFTAGNLYSGSGPADGTGTGVVTSFAGFNTMVGKILNTQSIQEGADLLGHVDIPHTPFTAFGLLQWFQPNTRIQKDPLDFTRYDLGIQWQINKYLRAAFDSQAIQYYHSQFTYDENFPGNGNKTHLVPFAVPRDTHAFFLHLEFRY
jgi:hypothetical protein